MVLGTALRKPRVVSALRKSRCSSGDQVMRAFFWSTRRPRGTTSGALPLATSPAADAGSAASETLRLRAVHACMLPTLHCDPPERLGPLSAGCGRVLVASGPPGASERQLAGATLVASWLSMLPDTASLSFTQ